jgi:hypothetical protein
VETDAGELLAMCGAFHSMAHRLAAEHAKRLGAIVVVRDAHHAGRWIVATYRPPRKPMARRKACDCPERCHGGPGTLREQIRNAKHSIKCRPARPACRWRRHENGICLCAAYPYPHRERSGNCLARDGGSRFSESLHKRGRRYAA